MRGDARARAVPRRRPCAAAARTGEEEEEWRGRDSAGQGMDEY
jgi:hypothetical protein